MDSAHIFQLAAAPVIAFCVVSVVLASIHAVTNYKCPWWVAVNIESFVSIAPYEESVKWLHITKEDAIAYAAMLRIRGIKIDSVHKMDGKAKNVLGVGKARQRIDAIRIAISHAKRRLYSRSARGGQTIPS